ncbi:multidrug resistance efflux transporter family protein [Desulfovibrio sp. OttesenSCG-928-C06]|nr:multidrug resistance efflux transporter family protein [Desulfovibrio sp. OttesenSCG-928-C06]
MRAIIYGLTASFFFAFTFILNRSMELEGGFWAWSACLRFFVMLPMLLPLLLLMPGKNSGLARLRAALCHLRDNWLAYLIWSTVGFGLFYAPLSLAGAYGPGWLVAATWQITIIAGPLLAPLISRPVAPAHGKSAKSAWSGLFGSMRWSLLILLGVAMMQLEYAIDISAGEALFCVLPILLAAFMYPLGNRKMMEVCKDEVDTFQRVFNMVVASLPFWIIIAAYGGAVYGAPPAGQIAQSALVALFSGVIATLLFFSATNLVKNNPDRLAAVEATQSGEVLFALAGEIVLLSAPLPELFSLLGIALVIIGMVLHSLRRA